MTTSPTDVVKRFILCHNLGRFEEALNLLSEDVFYHNVPMDPMTGREAVRTFMDDFGVGTRFKVDWETIAIASSGDIVLTERVDTFTRDDGRCLSLPLMGSFRVRDGLITEWRDYFDLKEFEAQLANVLDDAPASNNKD